MLPRCRVRRGQDVPRARDVDPPVPPTSVLSSYPERPLIRVLDPSSAVRLPGQERLHATAYVADRLLLPADIPEDEAQAVIDLLAEAAGPYVTVRREDDDRAAKRRRVTLPTADGRDRVFGVVALVLAPADNAAAAPDAWRVLQSARAMGGEDGLVRRVQLDHVMFACVGIVGSPFHGTPFHGTPFHGTGVGEGTAIAGYGAPGRGGRQPVAWVGAAPMRSAVTNRRPRVAVLDTGCGKHRWWDDKADGRPDATTILTRGTLLDGSPVGLSDPATDPEVTGDLSGPLDGAIDALAGHGTFITGLVHQVCPDADVLAVRVVHSDGVIIESELVDALADLSELIRRHAHGEEHGLAVDVVNLSLGYYHETALDPLMDPVMYGLLEAMGRCGTVVVAAAGNDAVSRPMYPAAFSPFPTGFVPAPSSDAAPVVAVGAENPDGTVALFSNTGPWVNVWAPGAAMVSTMPETFDGGFQPEGKTTALGRVRASLDPDSYRAGFAVWSGTSFAAPVVGAEIAQALLQASESGAYPLLDEESDPSALVARAWNALEQSTSLAP